jgi:RecA/RadA recombinase
LAFSGDIDGGFATGLTIFAGASKSFKTMLGLLCMKAYMDKFKDAVCLFYDSEFGTPPDYLKAFKIDTSRIIHIPIEHVEQLKFDIVKRLEEIERGDHVFIFVDSLGNLASKKEVEDAADQKSVADMSRAKAIRSLLRIITPHLSMKELPCVMINHVYQTMEMYAKTVIPGGTAVTYAANQIFVISKSQEKDGTELAGYKFTINIEKSRFVREKSKLPFTVNFEGGIKKWSGLLDLALETGHVVKPSNGWYQAVGSDQKYREKDTHSPGFWNPIFESTDFKDAARKRFQLTSSNIMPVNFDPETGEVIED